MTLMMHPILWGLVTIMGWELGKWVMRLFRRWRFNKAVHAAGKALIDGLREGLNK